MISFEVHNYGVVIREGDLTATLEMEKPPEDNLELLRAVISYVSFYCRTKAGALIAFEIIKAIKGTIKIRDQEYEWEAINTFIQR